MKIKIKIEIKIKIQINIKNNIDFEIIRKIDSRIENIEKIECRMSGKGSGN
jgi:hypothetical protein